MTEPYYSDEHVTLWHGDALAMLRELPDASVDAVVTDPPYGIRFMGQAWDGADIERGIQVRRSQAPMPDGGKAGRNGGYQSAAAEAGRYDLSATEAFGEWCRLWATECLRVLKPGGHLLSFGGSRTWHRLAAAVEDAGFEIRDSIAWLYGSGFPKSLDVSKAIDKAARGVPQGGANPTSPNHGKYRTTTTEGKRWDGDSGQGYGAGGGRFLVDGEVSGSDTEHAASGVAGIAPDASEWHGWGTALKPAFEPIVVGRKPLNGTVAASLVEHGTGALNIDGCRVGDASTRRQNTAELGYHGGNLSDDYVTGSDSGRWPTNVVLDDTTAAVLDEQAGVSASRVGKPRRAESGDGWGMTATGAEYDDSGGASRFFPVFRYEAKADAAERPRVAGVAHPTVKPLDLMRWLVRLVTPPGGVVLDPFAGSGTTVEAALIEGFRCVAIEREADYLPLIEARIARRTNPARALELAGEDMGLLGLLDEEDGDAA